MPNIPTDAHKTSHYRPSRLDSSAPAPAHEGVPLTPSSSTSSMSSSSSASHPKIFASTRVEPYAPLRDRGCPRMRSPRPPSTPHGLQELSSSSSSSAVSSVCHSTPTTTSANIEVSFCAGCSGRIVDRFYLLAVERRWHAECLRCTACHCALDTATTCFAKDGNIFCKDDYQRLFSIRRCARCGQGISSAELVMRAREFVYHVQCFTCAQCHTQLTKGDHFGMNGALIYCRDHYQISSPMEGASLSPLGIPPTSHYQGPVLAPGPLPALPHSHHSHTHLPPDVMQGFQPQESIGKIHFFNGVGAPHKGRPRKRKPKEEPMDTNMNIPSAYDLEGAYSSLGNACQPVRTKRIRTSFKHHQLRTMKHYFSINHNPDAKDLKQLSQKTGLSKRVLQVWFQNARAKFRRQIMLSKDPKAEGGSSVCQDGSGAEGSGTEYASNSPSSAVPPLSPDTSSESSTTQLPYQQMF